MRTTIILLALLITFASACKTKSQGGGCCSKNTAAVVGQTEGKVSHEYIASGCGPVILIKSADGKDTQVLVPSTDLPKEFNKDGLTIKFNFRLLRMPMRQGCTTGQMAEISDLSK